MRSRTTSATTISKFQTKQQLIDNLVISSEDTPTAKQETAVFTFGYTCVYFRLRRTKDLCAIIMADSGDQVPGGSRADDVDEDPELQRLQAEEDELAERVSAQVSEELSSHIAKLEQDLKLAFDERMASIHQQCSTQAAEVISTRQVF